MVDMISNSKRGQGLSMNIVVVAIIAVIVLVIIAIIFTGGVGNAYQKVVGIFNIGTSGQTIEFARQSCELACTSAQDLEDPTKSAYCQKIFDIDTNNDGKADKAENCIEVYPCSGVQNKCVGLDTKTNERTDEIQESVKV